MDEKRKAEERRLAEQKRKEDAKRLAEKKKLELKNRLKEEREKVRLEKNRREEIALQQQASELENVLLAKAQAEASAKQRQKELSEIDRHKWAIYQAIRQSWLEPPGDITGLEAHLALELLPTGEIHSVKIKKSSGNTAFDRSALNAAYKAGKSNFSVPRNSRLFNENFRNMTLKFKPPSGT